jgi:predicted dehydrogenase
VKISRILIVGSGSIAMRHFNIAKLFFPKASFSFLTRKSAKEIQCKDIRVFKSIEEALFFSPQIVVIANPASLHISTALPFAKLGSHLLIEKPLSINQKDILKILKIVKDKNTVLTVGYNLRHENSLKKFKELIESKKIGNLLIANIEVGQYLPNWRVGDYRKTVSAKSNLGGGVLFELSHEIDYMRWIFGNPEWVQASLLKQSNLAIDVEDSVKAIFSIKSKERTESLLVGMHLDFVRHDTTRLCTVIGSNGSIRWNGLTGAVELYLKGALDWKVIFQGKSDCYINEWKDFLMAIKRKDNPCVTGGDGLSTLKIIESMRLSNIKGKRIIFKE